MSEAAEGSKRVASIRWPAQDYRRFQWDLSTAGADGK